MTISMKNAVGKALVGVMGAGLLASVSPTALAAWEPEKPVEFIIPAGTGGGADNMARFIQGIVVKHKLMNQNLLPINKSAGSGAEGFLDLMNSKGNPHKIAITLSNLFTTPLGQGSPYNWKNMTPVAMLALDQFILWTNTEKGYTSAKDYIEKTKAAGPNKMKMAGTGAKQEDQIITVSIEKATGTKYIYLPFQGGGAVAVQLVGNHVDSTVNNPSEAVSHWKAGTLTAQCVLDDTRLPYKTKVTATQSWNDIPTCKEAGIPTDYVMLRGIFMAPGVTQEQVAFYVDLFKKVMATPEWKGYMEANAFNQTFMTGKEFNDWLTKAEALHKQLMTDGGLIKL